MIDERRLPLLLSALERSWRVVGAPIADCLAPGLPPDEIDSLSAAVGLVLPEGLRIWWGWHNGIRPDATDPERASTGFGFDFISLQEALDNRAELLRDASEPLDREGQMYWRSTWLPFVGRAGGTLFVDTATYGSSPVRTLTWEWEDLLKVRAWSITEVVETWTYVLAREWVYREPGAEGGWTQSDNLPLHLTLSGLL